MATVQGVEVFECMRCAPTTRRFSTEPVSRQALLHVLECARFAPSGGNRQGWRVIAVEDPARRSALGELYLPHWRAYMQQTGGAQVLADPDSFDTAIVRRVQGANDYAEHLDRVPLHLLVCVRLEDLAVTDADLPRQSVVGGASVYPFVQNLLLGLRAEGLAGALTTLLVPAEEEVKALLGIPDGIALAAHIGVGYRTDPWPSSLTRNPVSDFAHLDSWGQPLVD